MKVTYDEDLRKEAAEKGHGVFTIDYEGGGFPKGGVSWRGGMTVQGPMTHSKARLILKFIERLKKESGEEK